MEFINATDWEEFNLRWPDAAAFLRKRQLINELQYFREIKGCMLLSREL